MPFNLHIISKTGTQFVSGRSPYENRGETRATVRICVEDAEHGRPDPVRANAFADTVLAAPLGTEVKDAVSGITFRTEEI